MKAHVSSILLGVKELDQAKRFYAEGLGWEIKKDCGGVVFFGSDGSPLIGLYEREGLADQVGTSPEGSGFGGMVLTYVVRGEGRVDEIMAAAEKAGATLLKPAGPLDRGGYGGAFADLDGHIWSLGHSDQGMDQPYAE